MSSRARFAGLALGFVLLTGAWIMSTAPFAGPDEQSHFVRALGLSEGVILGEKVTYGDPGLSPLQEAFIDRDTRAYRVPTLLEPYDVGCRDGKPDVGSCLVASPNGNFPPLGYILPAIALRFPDRVSSALWLARVGSALQSVIFLVLALLLLWDGTTESILGLLAAVSPMVLFVASILNPSGIQITSALALAAAGLRIARSPAAAPSWVWVSLAVSGAVTILCGPIGLVFALADLLVAGAMLRHGGVRAVWREQRRATGLCAAALAAAAVLALAYTRIAGFSGKIGFSPFGLALQVGWQQLLGVLRVAVGNFGAQTVPLSGTACDIWFGIVGGLVLAALWLGTLRDRVVVLAVTVLALAFPVLYWAWVDRWSGFPILGREVMPPLLLIPLVAGEVVHRRRPTVASWRRMPPASVVLALLIVSFQAYAFGFNEHLAPHDVTLLPKAVFTPPLGWTPWTALATVGLLSLLVSTAGELLVIAPA